MRILLALTGLLAILANGAAVEPRSTIDGMSASGLHYRIEGSGPVVVLVHAFQMDLREWDEVAARLVGSRRVVRYDVRGHGRSTVPASLPASAEDLADLMRELRIARATIAGLSMGSNIALDFALTHAGQVEKLILISPGLAGIKSSANLDWMQPIVQAVKAGNARRAAELWWETPLLAGVRQRGTRALRYRAVVLDNAPVWTLKAPPPPLDPPAGKRLNEVTMPTLAVAGALDRSGSLEAATTIASGVVQGRSTVIDIAGHMLSLESPDELARLILEESR